MGVCGILTGIAYRIGRGRKEFWWRLQNSFAKQEKASFLPTEIHMERYGSALRKHARRSHACSQGPGGVLGNLSLIVLFMNLYRGFPVGFLMNWFVVETHGNADNYTRNRGSRLIFFPTSFQLPTIKHANYAV